MERIYGYVVVIPSVVETSKISLKERHVFLPSMKEDAFEFARQKREEGFNISFETLIAHFNEEDVK